MRLSATAQTADQYTVSMVLALQRTAGNAATHALLAPVDISVQRDPPPGDAPHRITRNVPAGRQLVVRWGDDAATVENAERLARGLRGNVAVVRMEDLLPGMLRNKRLLHLVAHGIRADPALPGPAIGVHGTARAASEELVGMLRAAGFRGGRIHLLVCWAGYADPVTNGSYARQLVRLLEADGYPTQVRASVGPVLALPRGSVHGPEGQPRVQRPVYGDQGVRDPGLGFVEERPGTGGTRPGRRAGRWARERAASGQSSAERPRLPAAETTPGAGGPHPGSMSGGGSPPVRSRPVRIRYAVEGAERSGAGTAVTIGYALSTERAAPGAPRQLEGRVRFVVGPTGRVGGVHGLAGESAATATAVGVHAVASGPWQPGTGGRLAVGLTWIGRGVFALSTAERLAENPEQAAGILAEAGAGLAGSELATYLVCTVTVGATGVGTLLCSVAAGAAGGAAGAALPAMAAAAYEGARHYPLTAPGSTVAAGGLRGRMDRDRQGAAAAAHEPDPEPDRAARRPTSGGATPPFADSTEPLACPLTGSARVDGDELRRRLGALSELARTALAHGLLPLRFRPLVPPGNAEASIERWARDAAASLGYRTEPLPARLEPIGHGAGAEYVFPGRGPAAEAARRQLEGAAPETTTAPREGPESIGRR